MSQGRAGRVSKGAVGGSAGEAGAEYRRGVAAYAAVYGLVGLPLPGFGVKSAEAQVSLVRLESDDPVDDIVVGFTSGWTAYVQAKRTLTLGLPLWKAVAQWCAAAQQGLDPSCHRLVVVSSSLSGRVRKLAEVLERHKRAEPGSWTAEEKHVLDELDKRLTGLTEEQRIAVLRSAVIHELAVEDPGHGGARESVVLLDRIIAPEGLGPLGAWDALRVDAGKLARQRAGEGISGWVGLLTGAGAQFRGNPSSPASMVAQRLDALERYRARLIVEGETLDLRGLGAVLPPLNLKDVGAEVEVKVSAQDEHETNDLLWAFLRRGRMVLTGLPGSGKSTSVRMLAAQLCQLSSAPLPVRVSLKDVDARAHTLSFRDRLLDAAVAEDHPSDREVLRAELSRRLDDGDLALLLDSLDETYERHPQVIADLSTMLRTTSMDVDVLLATREVAFAQASTLGWTSVAQGEPTNAEKIVEAITGERAPERMGRRRRKQMLANVSPDGSKIEWVLQAIARNHTLAETPLMPVLLSLLALERDREVLPSTRAGTLIEIVRGVVARYELARRPDVPLGILGPSDLEEGLMRAFAAEGAAILEQGGVAPKELAINEIAAQAERYWHLSPGHALAVARDALHFFDESGIFVMSGTAQSVSARITLFAEIAGALKMVQAPELDLATWVRDRIAADQLEPLILAASLSESAAAAFGDASVANGGADSLRAVVRARGEGASFPPEQLRAVLLKFCEHFAQGDQAAWDLFPEMMKLPVDDYLREPVEAAASVYDSSRQLVVQATLDLRLRSDDENRHDPERLRRFLRLRSLPDLRDPAAGQTAMLSLSSLRAESRLSEQQVVVARLLVGHDHDATEAAVDLAQIGMPVYEPIREILRSQAVAFVEPDDGLSEALGSSLSWLRRIPTDTHLKMLDAIIAAAPEDEGSYSELTYQQRTRLDELAEFLETFGMNDGGCHHMFTDAGDARDVIELFTLLFRFDLSVIAEQARITRTRVVDEECEATAFYGLFDQVQPRSEKAVDWTRVSDISLAIATLREMFTWGRPHAWAAARALWCCGSSPVRNQALLMLREVLEGVRSSADHVGIVAHTIISVTDGEEIAALAAHPEPAARAAAAKCMELAGGEQLAAQHLTLLSDVDSEVRIAALNRAAELKPADLEVVLVRATQEPDPGWRCRTCGTENSAGPRRSCVGEGCRSVGPSPAREAEKLLAARVNM